MDYKAIVVGGGHAGIEASLAIARLGFPTMLVTQNLDVIGKLSCNPAIGGLAKGNIVREVDALGGEMGKLIDASMLQFRILNKSRGPAVQAPRAQADRFLYQKLAKETVESQKNLHVYQDTVVDLILDHEKGLCRGIVTERGRRITSEVVVLTTGTFMEARIFIGEYRQSSGRLGEPAAIGLGTAMRAHGYRLGRLKTGTPARVKKSSIDFSRMEEQSGDNPMLPFSFSNEEIHRADHSCYITYTNDETHNIINENMGSSPLYSGEIVGAGPRYCPSIEDKVVRFPTRNRHQIFVEPEGADSEEMYLNGISSSLPEEVQYRFLKTLPGLENVEIMRPGYAVEYDFVDPTQLLPTLESKMHKGLYIAGQTNGTSGYEEAACQGLMAGINGALSLQGKEPLILTRDEAYTGVLIDDLVTLGTNEPYRMFTSRAEYRLSLRHDDCDMRLFPKSRYAGLLSGKAMELFEKKRNSLEEIKELLQSRRIKKADVENAPPSVAGHVGDSLFKAVKDPEVTIEELAEIEPALKRYKSQWVKHAELDVKYEGYIAKQEKQVARFKKMENVKIPADFDYDAIEGISTESREKLKKIRPLSVGQASRISGVRNPDIAVLLVLMGKENNVSAE
ncbi:MAG: tRNA uridine-5-carboxymethylaminomethyl(34) synthesis enzyme MnmG [Spirochaetales bacterium]|nr:tRNA uridine-5-carboxymethylaminomethyl(34) synthesis enzyme MnmG [Spirochaetales bacterium]